MRWDRETQRPIGPGVAHRCGVREAPGEAHLWGQGSTKSRPGFLPPPPPPVTQVTQSLWISEKRQLEIIPLRCLPALMFYDSMSKSVLYGTISSSIKNRTFFWMKYIFLPPEEYFRDYRANGCFPKYPRLKIEEGDQGKTSLDSLNSNRG